MWQNVCVSTYQIVCRQRKWIVIGIKKSPDHSLHKKLNFRQNGFVISYFDNNLTLII